MSVQLANLFGRQLLVVAVVLNFSAVACSNPLAAEVDPASLEPAKISVMMSLPKSSLIVGQQYYISSQSLNVRSSYSTKADNVVSQFDFNDIVEVIDLMDDSLPLVKIKPIKSHVKASLAPSLFVSKDFLSATPVPLPKEPWSEYNVPSKLFIIQNIATERARVYERCTESPGCPHKLIFETEMVAGRSKGLKEDPNFFKTSVGHYKIQSWRKFYEDSRQHYPAWYAANYPEVPRDVGTMTWLSKKLIPDFIQAKWESESQEKGYTVKGYRGAFGWFAAILFPEDESQWIHGTFGWGSDGDKFIRRTRGEFTNLFSDPQSSGCTRVENQAIAYLRHMLTIGTDVIRIYALEATREGYESKYPAEGQTMPWEWVLTVGAVNKPSISPDARVIEKANPNMEGVLDAGTYEVDQTPTPVGFTEPMFNPFKFRKTCAYDYTGKSGNTYCLELKQMQGVYIVDQGLLVEYRHPADDKIKREGFKESKSRLPDYVHSSESLAEGRFKMAVPYDFTPNDNGNNEGGFPR